MLSLNLAGEFRLIDAEAFDFQLADEPPLAFLMTLSKSDKHYVNYKSPPVGLPQSIPCIQAPRATAPGYPIPRRSSGANGIAALPRSAMMA
jgi:hypothetical protein